MPDMILTIASQLSDPNPQHFPQDLHRLRLAPRPPDFSPHRCQDQGRQPQDLSLDRVNMALSGRTRLRVDCMLRWQDMEGQLAAWLQARRHTVCQVWQPSGYVCLVYPDTQVDHRRALCF